MNYYEKNALDYIEKTSSIDMSDTYKEFLSYISKNGKILDVGFGSGRDSLHFKNDGYDVLGIDIVDEFIRHAKDLGLNVKKENVIDISYKNEFDGVFACASLLHLKEDQLIIALSKLKDSLKDEGIIYMSFKEGNFSGIRDGRYYLDMNEENMAKILDTVGLKLIKCWRNTDKLNRGNVWISFIVRDVISK